MARRDGRVEDARTINVDFDAAPVRPIANVVDRRKIV